MTAQATVRRTGKDDRFFIVAGLAAFAVVLIMVGPGLSRIEIQHVPIVGFLRTGGPFELFGLDLLLVYACIAYDTWRNHRLHPAFVFRNIAACPHRAAVHLDVPVVVDVDARRNVVRVVIAL
jgi:hypothetical protein